ALLEARPDLHVNDLARHAASERSVGTQRRGRRRRRSPAVADGRDAQLMRDSPATRWAASCEIRRFRPSWKAVFAHRGAIPRPVERVSMYQDTRRLLVITLFSVVAATLPA